MPAYGHSSEVELNNRLSYPFKPVLYHRVDLAGSLSQVTIGAIQPQELSVESDGKPGKNTHCG
jgi:hypothetical protein